MGSQRIGHNWVTELTNMTLDSKAASWSPFRGLFIVGLCLTEWTLHPRPLLLRCVTSGKLLDLSCMPGSRLHRREVHGSLFLSPLWPGGGPFPVVQTGTEPARMAVEKNFLAERVCLYSLLLCLQGSGKSSRPEKVYQIPFFTHPALNFMENKTDKKKKKKSSLMFESVTTWSLKSFKTEFLYLTIH